MTTELKEKTPEELLDEYEPRGHFAGVNIQGFEPFVRGEDVDEQKVKSAFNLTDEQLPYLYKELEAANILGNVSNKLASVEAYAEKHEQKLIPHAAGCQVVGSQSNGDGPATFIWKCVKDCPTKDVSLQFEDHQTQVAKAKEAALKTLPKDDLIAKAEQAGVEVKARDTKADIVKKIKEGQPDEEAKLAEEVK
jgi:hypothetical protein